MLLGLIHQPHLAEWLSLNIHQSCVQDAVEKPYKLLEVLTGSLMYLMPASIQMWTSGATTILLSRFLPPNC